MCAFRNSTLGCLNCSLCFIILRQWLKNYYCSWLPYVCIWGVVGFFWSAFTVWYSGDFFASRNSSFMAEALAQHYPKG